MPARGVSVLIVSALGAAAAAVGAVITGGGSAARAAVPVSGLFLARVRRFAVKKVPFTGVIAGVLGALYHSIALRVFFCVYLSTILLLFVSHRAQTWLIYLHWIRPPNWWSRPDLPQRHGMSGFARSIHTANLNGWHLLPPGVFAESEADYEQSLASAQRVILFFHGNSGTRAFPRKRVGVICTLAAQFNSHVITFDYSGFGDSGGRPNENQFYLDTKIMYNYVKRHTPPNTNSSTATDTAETRNIAVVVESAPSSLFDACTSHPTAAPFRIIPGIESLLRRVLRERLDSAGLIESSIFPLLVMHGDSDWMITPNQARKLDTCARKSGNQNVTLRMFKGFGHNDVFAADDYLVTVNAFLQKFAPLPRHI